jgi:hypothetical protein
MLVSPKRTIEGGHEINYSCQVCCSEGVEFWNVINQNNSACEMPNILRTYLLRHLICFSSSSSSSSSGATVHDEPWPLLRFLSLRPAAIVKSFSTVRAFYGVGPSTPRPTPNLKGQGIPFCLDHHFWSVQHGRPYQQLDYRQHSSQDHMTTQAPPLLQSSDMYGGVGGGDLLLLK